MFKVEDLRLVVTLKLGFVDNYLRLNSMEEAIFDKEINSLEEPIEDEAIEIITSWMKRGIERGVEQGVQQGSLARARNSVLLFYKPDFQEFQPLKSRN